MRRALFRGPRSRERGWAANPFATCFVGVLLAEVVAADRNEDEVEQTDSDASGVWDMLRSLRESCDGDVGKFSADAQGVQQLQACVQALATLSASASGKRSQSEQLNTKYSRALSDTLTLVDDFMKRKLRLLHEAALKDQSDASRLLINKVAGIQTDLKAIAGPHFQEATEAALKTSSSTGATSPGDSDGAPEQSPEEAAEQVADDAEHVANEIEDAMGGQASGEGGATEDATEGAVDEVAEEADAGEADPAEMAGSEEAETAAGAGGGEAGLAGGREAESAEDVSDGSVDIKEASDPEDDLKAGAPQEEDTEGHGFDDHRSHDEAQWIQRVEPVPRHVAPATPSAPTVDDERSGGEASIATSVVPAGATEEEPENIIFAETSQTVRPRGARAALPQQQQSRRLKQQQQQQHQHWQKHHVIAHAGAAAKASAGNTNNEPVAGHASAAHALQSHASHSPRRTAGDYQESSSVMAGHMSKLVRVGGKGSSGKSGPRKHSMVAAVGQSHKAARSDQSSSVSEAHGLHGNKMRALAETEMRSRNGPRSAVQAVTGMRQAAGRFARRAARHVRRVANVAAPSLPHGTRSPVGMS